VNHTLIVFVLALYTIMRIRGIISLSKAYILITAFTSVYQASIKLSLISASDFQIGL